jgi:hypothetical protein
MAGFLSFLLLFLITNCSSGPEGEMGTYTEDSAREFFTQALAYLSQKDFAAVNALTSDHSKEALYGYAQMLREVQSTSELRDLAPTAQFFLNRMLGLALRTELVSLSREEIVPFLLERDFFSFDQVAFKARDFSLVRLEGPNLAVYTMLESGMPRYFNAQLAEGRWTLGIDKEMVDAAGYGAQE